MPPPTPRPILSGERRWRRRYVLMGVALALMAFFGLRSSPFMQEVTWMPSWLSAWADRNWVLRSFVGFFAFGLLWFVSIGPRVSHALALAVFATAVEVAQIWIPRRVFDWKDIVASVAGIAASWLFVLAATSLLRRLSVGRV